VLVTVVRSVECGRDVTDLLAWCQSAQSRAHWPGVQRVRWDDTSVVPRLHYEVQIAAPGAPEAVVAVEERMCRPDEDTTAVFFESAQLWTWPTRHVAGAWATYQFVKTAEGAGLAFTYRYLLPDLADQDAFDRATFDASVERAVDLYIERLAQTGLPVAGQTAGSDRNRR